MIENKIYKNQLIKVKEDNSLKIEILETKPMTFIV